MQASQPELLRYVIQHHFGHGSEHFDLMLERGQVLWTWQIDRPLGRQAGPAEAVRIADHRAAYLTYEGPVRGGSLGVCRIVDGGRFCWIECCDDRIVIELLDGDAAGRWTLTRDPAAIDRWQIARL